MNKNKKVINWRIRAKNPVFWVQVLLAALTPILAYVGLSFGDLTTWSSIADLIQSAYSNPYLLGLIVISVYNSVIDPTVKGLKDSRQALMYHKPKDNK